MHDKNKQTRNECQSMKHDINACGIYHGTPQAMLNDLFASLMTAFQNNPAPCASQSTSSTDERTDMENTATSNGPGSTRCTRLTMKMI